MASAAEKMVFLSTRMIKSVSKAVIGGHQEFSFGNTDFRSLVDIKEGFSGDASGKAQPVGAGA